jgi:uncharacterized membrane protein
LLNREIVSSRENLIRKRCGSLVQVKFKCKICGRILEKEIHCGEKTEKYRRFALINNDAVNIISTAFSALLAMLIFVVI